MFSLYPLLYRTGSQGVGLLALGGLHGGAAAPADVAVVAVVAASSDNVWVQLPVELQSVAHHSLLHQAKLWHQLASESPP